MEALQIWEKSLETKKDIRAQMIRKRMSLSTTLWKNQVISITDTICMHPWFQETDTIYAYLDIKGEVGTRSLIEEAWKQKKKVAVPRVSGEIMDFYEVQSFEDVQAGAFQVEEPRPGTSPCSNEGLMLMPGVAFDEAGHRIGYGKGYYDRYLQKHPTLHTMALAFELQVLERIPFGAFDVSPECIVTERRIIRPNHKGDRG